MQKKMRNNINKNNKQEIHLHKYITNLNKPTNAQKHCSIHYTKYCNHTNKNSVFILYPLIVMFDLNRLQENIKKHNIYLIFLQKKSI